MKLLSNKSTLLFFVGLILLGFNSKAQNGKWTKSETPRFRNANSVWMLSQNYLVAAGGWLTNDSLTGLYTSNNAGKVWDFKLDNFGGQLNDVYFTDNNGVKTGYVCGKYGKFLRSTDSGKTWATKDLTSFPKSDLQSILFIGKDTCFIAGGGATGNRSLILTSNNQGNNWIVFLDSNNGKLTSIFAVDKLNIWACGENGLLYKSINGGNSWARVYIGGKANTKTLQSLFFTDLSNGYIVGGTSNIDTTQFICKTINGGNTWKIIRDTLSPKLNSITFYNKTDGYSVGNKGTVLYTSDAGNTWKKVIISTIINDNRDLKDAFFLNKNFGMLGGLQGKILYYNDTTAYLPKVKLNKVFFTSENKLRFEGEVSAEGNLTKCYIRYSTDKSFNNVTYIGDITGNDFKKITITLNLLKGFYYAKLIAKNDAGTAESSTLTAFSGPSDVPNFDFELWDTVVSEKVKGWDANGVFSRYLFRPGKYGLQVQSRPKSDGPGALLYGTPKDNGLIGGIPFKGKPTLISFRCRYNIAAGDSAGCVYYFKSKGKIIHSGSQKWTGKQMKDTILKFPITISDTSKVDSLIFAWLSTNFFAGKNDTASHLYADSMWFTGTTALIPNMGFNEWDITKSFQAKMWNDQTYFYSKSYSFFRSTHKHSGKYSGHLYTIPGDKSYPSITTSKPIYNSLSYPSFSLSARYNVLRGYVHFKPAAIGDSFLIRGTYFKNGIQKGWSEFIKTSADTGFVPVTIPISYSDASIPDSGTIQIYIYNGKRAGNPSSAEAWVDQFSFENLIDSFGTGFQSLNNKTRSWAIYPNPGSDNVTIRTSFNSEKSTLLLYSTEGKLLTQKQLSGHENILNISTYSNGMYFLILKSGNEFQTKHLLISK